MRSPFVVSFDSLGAVLLFTCCSLSAAEPPAFFEIRVIDQATGRGIPLVDLETIHGVRYVTDNAGRVAYSELGHAGQTIFFHVRPQGYAVPKDGFGIEGVRFKIEPGKSATLTLERRNVAERLYRVTGQDLYRDSLLLDHETPLAEPLGSGQVAGQDSVLAVPYRGRIAWFWGDTNRLAYPLGIFRTTGATSDLPGQGGLNPDTGVNLRYFTGKEGFARNMVEVADPKGVVWIDGVCTVPDESGRERLVAHFSRRPCLDKQFEHGLLLYNDERELFEVKATLPLTESWRFVRDHPERVTDGGVNYLQFGNPFPVTRVPATLAGVLNPERYESWTHLAADAEPNKSAPGRNSDGQLDWRWGNAPPVTQQDEQRWLKAGQLKPAEARYLPVDAAQPDKRVQMHAGTVRWNAYRRRWLMIAVEFATDRASPSFLGEVWCSESESAQGPWTKAVRIATHDKQSFYNPCHHSFFDEADGRRIYFEGTYCNTFTNSPPTPRYNYNQMMYRLDLDHPALRSAFPR